MKNLNFLAFGCWNMGCSKNNQTNIKNMVKFLDNNNDDNIKFLLLLGDNFYDDNNRFKKNTGLLEEDI